MGCGSDYIIKKLASLRAEVSIITDGLTGGGGIGRTCNIIQSGRAYLGFKPRSMQSSSLIRFNTLRTWKKVMLISLKKKETQQVNMKKMKQVPE